MEFFGHKIFYSFCDVCNHGTQSNELQIRGKNESLTLFLKAEFTSNKSVWKKILLPHVKNIVEIKLIIYVYSLPHNLYNESHNVF